MSRHTVSFGRILFPAAIALVVGFVLANVPDAQVAQARAEARVATAALSERVHIFYYP